MKQTKLVFILFLWVVLAGGCVSRNSVIERLGGFVIPAEEFSRSVKSGQGEEFSIFNVDPTHRARMKEASKKRLQDGGEAEAALHYVGGDPSYLEQGYTLKKSVAIPSANDIAPEKIQQPSRAAYASPLATLPAAPPGSSAPYLARQMKVNPSLWPDEAQGASLFRDVRAFQSMDIITIVINEQQSGSKKAETETESEFTLQAAISEFFGVETSKWAANNTSLDPTNLVNAETTSDFEGEAETTREGSLTGRISAVIMEVLPNGLLRIEGTKIISVNDEEEVMVISGLVRQRDIDAKNQIDSSRIANMRIDFYGRGLIADNQSPGWGARLFRILWPF